MEHATKIITMKASKVLVTLLLAGLVLSTGCSSTSKGVSTEGNSVKVDFAPLLTVDQPKPVVEAGPKVPFNPVLDAEGVETLKVKVPYWKTEVGLGQAKLLGDSVLVGKTTGINVKNLIHVSQDLPTFRVGTPVLNEGPFGLNVKDGGLNVKIPFVQARIPYPKIKKGE